MILTGEETTVRMNSEEIKTEYTNSLTDLTFNSKPLINMLTMLAEENLAHANVIVAAIEEHLSKVQTDVKLPILYLIDCIAKNIGSTYTQLFSQNIVMTFCSVFKVVDEKTRAEMFKLRQTWNDVFPQKKLYAIDVQINMLDPAWPVTAKPPSNSIHFNPKFLKPKQTTTVTPTTATITTTNEKEPKVQQTTEIVDTETITMQQKLIQKQKELIELQQKKLELELLQTQVKLQNQMKSNTKTSGNSSVNLRPNILLKPEVAKQLVSDVKTTKPSLAMNQRLSSGTKISPANSALVAAAAGQQRPQIRDPRLLRQQQPQKSIPVNNSNLGSKTTDRFVTNKGSVRENRNEARLVNNNKDSPVTTSTITTTTNISPHKISKTLSLKSKQSDTKTNKSRSSKSDISDNKTSTKVIDLVSSPNKSSNSNNTKEKSSPSKSQHKKSHNDNKKTFKDREKKLSTSFKGNKGSMKNRNYIRRNRSPSFSPEPQDIDLRIVSQPPPEKQMRLDSDVDKSKINQGMDVDLRQLPAVIQKKRSSTETVESSSKKTKSEMFDVLFGNEDTDLRKMPVVERPLTPPPPPIISLSDHKETETLKKSNLDAVRAKLANATNREKVLAKSFRRKPTVNQDEDLRNSNSNNNQKFIVSTAEFNGIKSGDMTDEQKNHLMNKIIAQMEHHKLLEAQKRDNEENNTSNVSLQPISDDELDVIEERNDQDDRYHSEYDKYHSDGRRGQFWRGTKRRHWDTNQTQQTPPPPPPLLSRQGAMRPWMNPNVQWRSIGPNSSFRSQKDDRKTSETPPPNDIVVDSVNQDDINTRNIDGIPRDIRYYNETAIVFMSWDDPREISFQNGNRRVIFDDKDMYLLAFNDDYKEVSVNGELHRVRLGAPSREIFIDGKPYECYFGGPGITIDLNGKMTMIKLDGPPPQVKIGTVKRTDLVAGKVNLIIDAKILVPVFLDAKLQKFIIDGETHTLKFVDALKTVLINDVRFNVEFGGLPKPITVHNKKHFIRFSVLPRGIKPGLVNIKDMEGVNCTATNPINDGNFEDVIEDNGLIVDNNEPALPVVNRVKKIEEDSERNSNSPHMFQNFMQQNNLDVLSNVLASNTPSKNTSDGYQVENIVQSNENSQSIDLQSNPISLLPSSININELFQKLVATGIVATDNSISEPAIATETPKPIKRNLLNCMKYVTFDKPETLKRRQSGLIEALYSGMQCSSCGMRFPPEQSIHYSQHLDWHFRQNRKGKRNIRVAASRRWYYSLSDWKNYEEIEDLEEREKNYFDQQLQQNEIANDENEDEIEIPSVPANNQDPSCHVCHDKFDQFFNEEKEEWHLKNAIRVDDKTYHPVCYEDYQQSLLNDGNEQKIEEIEKNEETTQTIIPGLEIVLDDEDEEMDSKDDAVIIEESDESKQIQEIVNKIEEEDDEEEDDDDDDDVIIHEVIPEKIVVNDDDEYEETLQLPIEKLPIKVEHISNIDDGFIDVEEGLIQLKNGCDIKIKSEPIDHDDMTIDEDVMDSEIAEQLPPTTVSSIDGNTEMTGSVQMPTTQTSVSGKIKINISKPLLPINPNPTRELNSKDILSECNVVREQATLIDPSQPLPPGEEPIQLNVKESLRGIEFKKLPMIKKGSELTGMCSIM